MAEYSNLAWLIWTQKTGGSDDAEPTLSEVQRYVDMFAASEATLDYWGQFKNENDRTPDADFLIPFYDLPLTNNPSVANEKYVDLPTDAVLPLPKGRGINLVTYGSPEQKIQITQKNYLMSWSSDYRAYQGEYFCYQLGTRLYFQGISTEERPEISKVNLILACAGGTSIPKLIEGAVYVKVMAALSQPTLPDNNPDQRNSRASS
jgi:hypothetical protein